MDTNMDDTKSIVANERIQYLLPDGNDSMMNSDITIHKKDNDHSPIIYDRDDFIQFNNN